MLKLKIIISVCVFSILLGITSIIKTETRIVEKKIFKVDRKIIVAKKDLHETQLDYSYLSSPNELSKKIIELAFIEYFPMDYSRIYLSYLDFINAQKKLTILKKNNEEKK
jgi:hypothetical protein|tara:strand:+ start:209 stop:538 length:330 start_codon:yes stop_codon:yes gene_type:complete